MYVLVRYKKPAKHLVGASNKVIGRTTTFKTLIDTRRLLPVTLGTWTEEETIKTMDMLMGKQRKIS